MQLNGLTLDTIHRASVFKGHANGHTHQRIGQGNKV